MAIILIINCVHLEEVVKSAKAWQKTGREDILLHVNEALPNNRIDEIRLALRRCACISCEFICTRI